jgi:hypothetical protein
MGGRAFPIEQPGGREDEHARTDGHDTCAASVGALQRGKQLPRRIFVDISPAGNHDHIGTIQCGQAALGLNGDATESRHAFSVNGTRAEPIPGHLQLGPWQRKRLDDDATLERA